ncbi:MAG TPA: sugar phosphate isomerase/epimerase [Thermoprotei archaeon]|nr:sugar phosphate isomerase/epimerase [Thermoprotei archaeon]
MEWRKWLDRASYIDAEIVTIHSNLTFSSNIFREIGDYAQDLDIKIGIKNDGRSMLEYIDIIKRIDHPYIGATLDLGHCGFFQEILIVKELSKRIKILNKIICSLIRDLGSKLFLLHVYNIDTARWIDHRSLPNEAIDFHRVIKTLSDIGYNGFYIIELEEIAWREKAVESGRFLSNLLSIYT